jgi:alpha-1,6-mannosyltransferase
MFGLEQQDLSPRLILLATLFLCGVGWMGYVVEQDQFFRILGGYGSLFVLYFFLLRDTQTQHHWRIWLGLAFGFRVVLWFAFPGLSDDLYRFIWDGRLLAQGINPFDQLPGYYLEAGQEVQGLTAELFANLNSPEYYTIYPPVAQAVFGVACWLFPNSILGSMLVMKFFLVACEGLTLWTLPKLLSRFRLPAAHSLIYALNPLIIIEITGNLHFEGAMVAFLVSALLLLTGKRDWAAAAAMALSIASKLLSLIFLPFFLRRLGWKRALTFYLITGGICLFFFAPLFNGVFFQNFGESLDLYFRKFEFNASVYYVLRWVGFQTAGYNLIAYIGPALAMVTTLGILLFAFLRPDDHWKPTLRYMLSAICLYLALTTTVHPWYLSLPIVLCAFTPFRFPIVWSALITLTYINYSYDPYHENLWVVGIEYLFTGCFFAWEGIRYLRYR